MVFPIDLLKAFFSHWSVVLPLSSSVEPLGADLSTIIEAENSGISKHIPLLGDSTHGDGDDDTPTSPFNLEKIDKNKSRFPSPDSRAASIFDLSTSRLDTEVMHALKVEDATTASEWLNGVNSIVVEGDTDEHDPFLRPGDEDPDAALDFGALDPDLAQLLSPNKINGKSQIPSAIASRLPSRNHSRSPSHPVSNPSFRPPNGDGVPSRASPSPRLGLAIPSSASRAIVQSSPTRRSASMSRANPPRGPPSALPRLTRSVTATPPASSASDSSHGTSTPSGLRNPSKKRHQPPSPLSAQSHSSQGPSSASSRGSTDMPPRRPAGSRLATPNRQVSSYAPGNSRLADPPPSLLPSPSEMGLSSQFSTRSASDPTRQPNSRPSLEFSGQLDVNKRRRPHLFYNRRRSMSVEDARLSPTSGSTSPIRPSSSLSNRPPIMEWLGPRTVKAFAAAGLIDGDRDGSNAHASGASRYATLRAHSEREERFAPSRTAFSEAASTSSWGRSGSVSRGMTPSEGGVTWGSPTFSAPRTTFSGSTAPTSISATSSSQQAAIQLMKEKHDLETEALLSALSDSQRTTKTLREENLQLRDRIRELEDQLDEMRTQIHRFASGVLPPCAPLTGSFPRSSHDRLLPSPLAATRRLVTQRPLSHIYANGFTVSGEDHSPQSSRAASPARGDSPVPVTVVAPCPRRRRASTSSSVFPNVPQNMSMLMLEDTMHDRSGLLSMPSSPIPQRASLCNGNGSSGHAYAHAAHPPAHHPSSGTGNTSPTIASFSMTEIPGSPSSLQLRPEHELHLGDMATLSLYAMSDEEL